MRLRLGGPYRQEPRDPRSMKIITPEQAHAKIHALIEDTRRGSEAFPLRPIERSSPFGWRFWSERTTAYSKRHEADA